MVSSQNPSCDANMVTNWMGGTITKDVKNTTHIEIEDDVIQWLRGPQPSHIFSVALNIG